MILLIDTATHAGFVAIAENGIIISSRTTTNQQAQAAFLQPAIAELLNTTKTRWQDIKAVAVSNGPGSYTGLRVGLASAKGICFAHKIPLICLYTTEIMAGEWLLEAQQMGLPLPPSPFCIIPMIDARRMEVFTAVYDTSLQTLEAPHNAILESDAFQDYLNQFPCYFIGDGMPKWRPICTHPQAQYADYTLQLKGPSFFAQLAEKRLKAMLFNDLAYTEPYYIKEFYTHISK